MCYFKKKLMKEKIMDNNQLEKNKNVILETVEYVKDMFLLKGSISYLQVTLSLMLTLSLVLSNILVVKPIYLFGISWLPTTVAVITFPLTYCLSDIFQEVYGYRWSRMTANWAFLGTLLASALFLGMIAIRGSADWSGEQQTALESVVGSTPLISFASVLALWTGDFFNDRVFRAIKRRQSSDKTFAIRALVSSAVGKYVDAVVFTFIGLHFLPLRTKVLMVLTAPATQVVIETLVMPLTHKAAMKLKKLENRSNSINSDVLYSFDNRQIRR